MLTTHEYFERIQEETRNILAAKLTPRGKFESQVTHKNMYKRRFVSVKNKRAPVLSNFYEIGHHFDRECLRF